MLCTCATTQLPLQPKLLLLQLRMVGMMTQPQYLAVFQRYSAYLTAVSGNQGRKHPLYLKAAPQAAGQRGAEHTLGPCFT